MPDGNIADGHANRYRHDSFCSRRAGWFFPCNDFADRGVDLRQAAGELRVGLSIFRHTTFADPVKILGQRNIVDNKLRGTVERFCRVGTAQRREEFFG